MHAADGKYMYIETMYPYRRELEDLNAKLICMCMSSYIQTLPGIQKVYYCYSMQLMFFSRTYVYEAIYVSTGCFCVMSAKLIHM